MPSDQMGSSAQGSHTVTDVPSTLCGDVFSGTERADFGVGRRVWHVAAENEPCACTCAAGAGTAESGSLGTRAGNFLVFSTLETEKSFFILEEAVLYPSAFVGECVRGGTFCFSTCTNWVELIKIRKRVIDSTNQKYKF